MDYDLHLKTLSDKAGEFSNLKSTADELVNACNELASTIKKSSEISGLESSLTAASSKIDKGYNNCNTWITSYNTDVNNAEDELAKFEGPILKANFSNIFTKILVPALKGTTDGKETIKNLGKSGQYGNLDMTNYPKGNSYEDGLARSVLVAKYLVEHGGFTKEQAAALAGVYLDENNCDPGEVMQEEKDGNGAAGTGGDNYGAGIASWTFDKDVSLIAAGYPSGTPIESLSMQQQCDMIIAETQTDTYKTYYDALKRCESIEDASATSVVMIGGPGYSSNWDTHPTPAEAKAMSDWYGSSNDSTYGASPYHWDLDVRRLENAKKIYANM